MKNSACCSDVKVARANLTGLVPSSLSGRLIQTTSVNVSNMLNVSRCMSFGGMPG